MLVEKGKKNGGVSNLIGDSRRWVELHELLQLHVKKSREIHEYFENNIAFSHEVREFDGRRIQSKQPMPSSLPAQPESSPTTLTSEQSSKPNAIMDLANQINTMEKSCSAKIAGLEERTTKMIERVSVSSSRVSPPAYDFVVITT
jgi:hypothetical protein